MKYIVHFRLLICCCLLLGLFSACKKNQETPNTSNPTILQYIAADSQLTLLRTAITRCNLDTVFASGGPYTFFCPNDSAFIAAGLTADSIARYNPDSLSNLLKYHILSGKFSSSDLIGFVSENVTSLDTAAKPFLTKNYYGIFLNGIGVADGNIELGDGVIQKIGRIAFPPTMTIQQTLNSRPELSYFAEVVNDVAVFQTLLSTYNVSNGQQGGVWIYSGETVLVPTNAAFQQSTLYPTIASIDQAGSNQLIGSFAVVFLNGFCFTSDFLGGFVPGVTRNEELPGFTVVNYTIAEDGVTIIPGYPVGEPPVIIVPNILCTDGVIQEISEVFIAG